jgi:hypothetical protein
MIYELNYSFYKCGFIFFEESPYNIKGYDMIQFYHCNNAINLENYRRTNDLTSLIDLSLDKEILWNNLHSKARQKIRNAKECGVKIKINENYTEFKELYQKFKIKKGFGNPITHLPLLNDIKKHGFLFTSELDGDILSGAQFIREKNNILCWIFASKRLESKEIAKKCNYSNNYLIWEAITYAKQIGVTEWDWAGLWSEEKIKNDNSKKGNNDFKLSFGGSIVTRYNYEKYSKRFELTAKLYRSIPKKRVNGEDL